MPKRRSIGDIAIGIKKLRVIEYVETLRSELNFNALPCLKGLVNRQVQIRHPWAAAYGARGVADLAQGRIDERRRIEEVAAGFLRIEPPEGRDRAGLAGGFVVEAAHQLLIAAGGQANWKSRLQCENAGEGPSVG